jgi:hypothetical protein
MMSTIEDGGSDGGGLKSKTDGSDGDTEISSTPTEYRESPDGECCMGSWVLRLQFVDFPAFVRR